MVNTCVISFIPRNSRKSKKGIPIYCRIQIGKTIADSKLIFSTCLKCLCSSVVLIHNHPSGNNTPSNSDIRLTNKLVEAGKLLDIKVLDHLIITSGSYYSFADEGLI